jgi:FkbM family methyltransferase
LPNFLKPFIFAFHDAISKSEKATQIYLNFLGLLLKHIPDNIGKSKVLNLLDDCRYKWPQVEFAPQEVRIAGSSLTIKLIGYVPEPDFAALFFKTLTYEKGIILYLEQHIRDYDAIIEIGANIGLFTICFSKWFSRWGKSCNNIFSFEPSREAYLRLLKNLKLNGIEGVQTFNLAVARTHDFVNFYEPMGCLTNGSLYRDFAEIFTNLIRINKTIAISGNLLERLIENNPRILLKINAEGAESEILQSMKDFIIKRRPTIIVEVLPPYLDQLNQLDFLFSAQYSFFNITDKGLQRRDKFIASDFYNYLLFPLV